MATRMLIDARHPEETRVAVLKGNRIEEFDFESAEHKQIKGNIYLAKVTRVEPSLQAAFVDFGGNRHGFLAFSEIHPDYYQIPQSDRDALLAEEQAAAEEEAALRAEDEDDELSDGDTFGDDDEERGGSGVEEIDTSEKDHVSTIEDGLVENGDDDNGNSSEDGDDDSDGKARSQRGRGRGRRQGRGNSGSRAREMDQIKAKRQELRRRYKIQDVIQRRQVLLVQVVKEERGNKGAALTTYLSLAGRYCVLMPNSSHGGGISRKISSGSDRKRLKQIVGELSLPRSMGLIVRTAGLQRTKTEIKRDFDYLARLWDEIRERTLGSSAPSVIHSDSDLIKRAIRDIYNREIEEVIVEGDEGYKAAKQFMKLLMPSHARRVKHYSDPVPLFQRYGAEDQLSAMYDPMVQLKSGGYLIINPTEALVSIDINSGRSTKEHGIEQTALHTNLEAAREIARQLRLRDMAGLVVIDFIDMENNGNVRKVERAMKDALKNDRARIQVGRISGFGLMEMSRQRLRTGVLEATTRECPHCDGTGLVRTASSAGLSALRLIEDEAAKGKGTIITLYASTEAAVYLLNAKRGDLAEIESRYGVSVAVQPEGEDEGAKMRVDSSGPRPTEAPRFDPIIDDDDDDDDAGFDDTDDEQDEQDEQTGRGENDARGSDDDDDAERKRKRRRRRGGRGRSRSRQDDDDRTGDDRAGDDRTGGDRSVGDRSDSDGEDTGNADRNDDAADGGSDERSDGENDSSENANAENANAENGGADSDGTEKPKRRRRRGGRGRSRRQQDGESSGEDDGDTADASSGAAAAEDSGQTETPTEAEAPPEAETEAPPEAEAVAEEAAAETAPEPEAEAKPKRRTRRKKAEPAEAPAAEEAAKSADVGDADATGDGAAKPEPEAKAKPKRTRRRKADPAPEAAAAPAPEAPAAVVAEPEMGPDAEAVEPPASKSGQDEPATDAPGAPLETASQAPASRSASDSDAHSNGGSGPVTDGGASDGDGDGEGEGDSPRRGWWQRTFGN